MWISVGFLSLGTVNCRFINVDWKCLKPAWPTGEIRCIAPSLMRLSAEHPGRMRGDDRKFTYKLSR